MLWIEGTGAATATDATAEAGVVVTAGGDAGVVRAAGAVAVAAELETGAAMPRLRSSAFSSSISAFMAANSLATAGGMPGSGVAAAESGEAADELALPGFADPLPLLLME